MTEKPFRVVYVVPKWNQPTETFVRREVAAMVDLGVRVQVVSLDVPGPSDGIVDDERLRIVVPAPRDVVGGLSAVLRSPRRGLRGLALALRLGRRGTRWPHVQSWLASLAVERHLEPTDIVLAHFAWVSATVAHDLATLRAIPYAVFVHAYGVYETRCQDAYLTHRLRHAARVFVESPLIAADVRSAHVVDPIVMRMGVPRAQLVPSVPPPRTASSTTVVSVGALRKKKGHDTLIRAVAPLDGVSLRIAGEGDERPNLEALIDELGLGERVELLGHVDGAQVRALLDDADLFCLASRPTLTGDRDGVPNVLIEAMARGVSIVSTRVSGIPDLLEGCGELVESDDVDALRAAIRLLRSDPERRQSLAAAALERVRADYVAEDNAQRLLRELQGSLAS